MTRLATILLMAAAVTTTACASNSEPATGPAPARAADARVQVSNNNWLDMTVYAQRGSSRVRLGTVTSMATRMLALPRTLLNGAGSVLLVADPIGGPTAYSSQSLHVWPGQTIEFVIENQPGISRVGIAPD